MKVNGTLRTLSQSWVMSRQDKVPEGRLAIRNGGIEEHVLTLTGLLSPYVAWAALALHNWNHPLSICGAVDSRRLLTDGVVHALPAHLLERLVLTSGYSLWEGCEALHRLGAGLVVHSDGQKGDAGSDVLEGQVEAFSRQVLHNPRLRVDAHSAFAGDLIRSDGGHLPKLALAEGHAHVCI